MTDPSPFAKQAPQSQRRNDDVRRLEEESTPPTPVIYEVVRRLGKEEMERPAVSLWWSGIAAGLSISFSLLVSGILRMHLPEAPWRHLVVAFGYPVGFLMAVLSRQQLFTENTITVVLPIMKEPTRAHLLCGLRMWAVVLLANLSATLFATIFCTYAPVIGPELRSSMLEVARTAMAHGWLEMAFRAITAGFLMAAMVWLVPSAGGAQFHVVVIITYIIGAGDFAHIVAGSMEAFMLVAAGSMSITALLTHFLLPVLAGNIVGGTVLFAVLSYAQVMKEI